MQLVDIGSWYKVYMTWQTYGVRAGPMVLPNPSIGVEAEGGAGGKEKEQGKEASS